MTSVSCSPPGRAALNSGWDLQPTSITVKLLLENLSILAWICRWRYIQWTLSNPTTLGTRRSGLIEGWPHSGLNLYCEVYFWTFHSGLNTGVATFQGSSLEGVHCNIDFT